MSGNGNLRLAFVIEAIDRATAKVRAVNQAVDKSTEPVRRARAAARELFQEAGWGRLQQRWAAIQERGAALLGTVRGVATGVAAVAAGLGAGVFGVKRVADEVDRLADTAAALGMTTQQLQRMGFAAQMNGSTVDEMAQSLVFLNKNMGEARGGSKEALLNFQRVGITLADLRNPAFNAGAAFERMADTFRRVGDAGNNGGKKIEVSTALLGRAGFRQIQFLNGGSQAMRDAYREADRLGVVLGADTVRNMGAFNDSWDRLRLTLFGAIANALGPAAPKLQAVLERTVEWTAANRELIATRVGQFFTSLMQTLPPLTTALAQIAQVMVSLAAGADRVAQAVGGWGNVLTALAALLATKVVVQVVALVAAIASALPTIIGVGKIVFWLASGLLAVAGTPALIAAGLVGAAAAIWAAWEPLGRLFGGIWATIKGLGSLAGRALGFGSGGAATAAAAAAPSAIAVAGGAPQLGGTLRIYVDGEGKARVQELRKSAGSPLDLDVYTGLGMAGG